MKIYVVCENGSEETNQPCGSIEVSRRPFSSCADAQAECDRLNEGQDGRYRVDEIKVSKAVAAFLCRFYEDDLREMFGDGVRIAVQRKNNNVELRTATTTTKE